MCVRKRGSSAQYVEDCLLLLVTTACVCLGYGGMSLSIEGPSKADIECHDNEDGTCRVTYKPTEPGTYIINIKFADEHVPGVYDHVDPSNTGWVMVLSLL